MSRGAAIRPESLRFQVSEEISIGPPESTAPARARLLNLSLTGMFVQTDATYPAGTELRFETRLSGADRKASGIAEVIWRRSVMSGPGRPAGMGCAFRRVSPASREAIRAFLASREQALIERIPPERLTLTEELSKMVAEAIPATPSSMELPRSPPPARPVAQSYRSQRAVRSGSSPWLLVLVGGLVAGLLGALAFYRWSTTGPLPSAAAGPPPPQRSQGPGPATAATAARPARAGSPPAPTALEVADSPEIALERAVRVWADAWSHQSVDAYLSSYSLRFRPEDGQSRADWAASRRERLLAPGYIQVSVDDLQVEQLLEESAAVSFVQTYRSDTFSDRVRKRLELVLEQGRWKISSETVLTT